MQKFFVISVLATLAGCAMMPPPATTPPIPTTPDTPVFFQPLSAALDAPAEATIAKVAKAAAAEPAAPITVTGAADTIGSSTANADLSQTRAQVVADQLIKDGISAARVTVRGIGAVQAPTVPGTPAQFSRRALIHIGS